MFRKQNSCFFLPLWTRPLPPRLCKVGWPPSSDFVYAKNDLVQLNWINSWHIPNPHFPIHAKAIIGVKNGHAIHTTLQVLCSIYLEEFRLPLLLPHIKFVLHVVTMHVCKCTSQSICMYASVHLSLYTQPPRTYGHILVWLRIYNHRMNLSS
jgi:hypothetical protein